MTELQETKNSIETDRDKPLMVSSLSTFSMVMGFASCLLLVLVVPAVVTAILAIIFGHISAAHVRANKVELLGLGRSRVGLMLGYICLALAAFLFPREVCGNRESSHGDGPDATDMASRFVRELKSLLKDSLELEDGKGLSWDSSRLRCHCYANSGIVFIVREPKLAGFNDAALEVLAHAAWRVALETVQNSGEFEADFPVAVCVMGKRRCQTFVMGQALNVDETLQEPAYLGPDADEVLALFQ